MKYGRNSRRGACGSRTARSAGGEHLIDQQLGYELARYVFGPTAERRRRVRDDHQIGQAVALLRQAQTPSALLGLASAPPVPVSLIHHPDAGGHLEGEGVLRHRPVDPHLG